MNTIVYDIRNNPADPEVMAQAAAVLRRGGLVAFPTETVYGLGGDGLNPEASARIYAAKGRPSDNPLILHISRPAELYPLIGDFPETAGQLMRAFWPGPLTMIFRKSDLVPSQTTGGLDTVAIRMPSHPAAQALIRAAGVPIAAPSANTSGRPSPTEAFHVLEDMDGRIDMVLDGGQVQIGLESTIVDVTEDEPVILRPGFITLEDVRRVTGGGLLDAGVLNKPAAGQRPKAPGMKYRHYAPKAELVLVDGQPDGVVSTINAKVREAIDANKRVGIIATEESRNRYPLGIVKSIGRRSSEETIAHNLFRVLREFDDAGVDIIYSESFKSDDLGQAIMNRLMKAAGYHTIFVM